MRSGHWGGLFAIAAVGACGGDGGDCGADADLDVCVIDEAMAAVDAERGGPQRFFEVTANAQIVRLYVEEPADDGVEQTGETQVVTYAYVDGELVESGRPQGAEGETFAASDVTFDPDAILDRVEEEVPDADVEELSIVGTGAGPPRYAAFARSDAGGVLDITLSNDGEVLEVAPASLRS